MRGNQNDNVMIEQDMAEIYLLAKEVYLGNLRQIDARHQIQSKLSIPINDNSFIDFVQLYAICLMGLNILVE